MKLLGFPPSQFSPPLFSLFGVAGMIELVGGLLLLVGLFTRPVAFLLAGEMAVAYFMAHAPHSLFPIINQGEAAILFCFVFLYVAAAGAGPWSARSLARSRQPGGRVGAGGRPVLEVEVGVVRGSRHAAHLIGEDGAEGRPRLHPRVPGLRRRFLLPRHFAEIVDHRERRPGGEVGER